jgi:hypothetical protein
MCAARCHRLGSQTALASAFAQQRRDFAAVARIRAEIRALLVMAGDRR